MFLSNAQIQPNGKISTIWAVYGVKSYKYFIKYLNACFLSFLMNNALQLLCQFTTDIHTAKKKNKNKKKTDDRTVTETIEPHYMG